MTTQIPDPEPGTNTRPVPGRVSDQCPPAMLDESLLVFIVGPTGDAFMVAATDVDDTAVAEWLRLLADRVQAGEHRQPCQQCLTGDAHPHV